MSLMATLCERVAWSPLSLLVSAETQHGLKLPSGSLRVAPRFVGGGLEEHPLGA